MSWLPTRIYMSYKLNANVCPGGKKSRLRTIQGTKWGKKALRLFCWSLSRSPPRLCSPQVTPLTCSYIKHFVMEKEALLHLAYTKWAFHRSQPSLHLLGSSQGAHRIPGSLYPQWPPTGLESSGKQRQFIIGSLILPRPAIPSCTTNKSLSHTNCWWRVFSKHSRYYHARQNSCDYSQDTVNIWLIPSWKKWKRSSYPHLRSQLFPPLPLCHPYALLPRLWVAISRS